MAKGDGVKRTVRMRTIALSVNAYENVRVRENEEGGKKNGNY